MEARLRGVEAESQALKAEAADTNQKRESLRMELASLQVWLVVVLVESSSERVVFLCFCHEVGCNTYMREPLLVDLGCSYCRYACRRMQQLKFTRFP